uniref:Alpha-conotoxin TiIA n=1 Tax=Conus tinianus TaxID=909294 RepID=CA1A_CONTI|nr:RecName: Full=Alpha-conotoxin TiIA [Conus tinianus]
GGCCSHPACQNNPDYC